MHIQPSKEDLIHLTKLNPFDRFPDGRPQVPEDFLERMKLVTIEEAWAVLKNHGYHRQFEGGFMQTHPGTILVGRALTASFLPHRPDYHDSIQEAGTADGRGKIGGQNSWIIESLQLHDVMVVDLRGKIENGTIVGDNLGTAVRTRTRAGLVVDGAIRDLPGLVTLKVFRRLWRRVKLFVCAMNLGRCVWMKANTPAVKLMCHPGVRILKQISLRGERQIANE